MEVCEAHLGDGDRRGNGGLGMRIRTRIFKIDLHTHLSKRTTIHRMILLQLRSGVVTKNSARESPSQSKLEALHLQNH